MLMSPGGKCYVTVKLFNAHASRMKSWFDGARLFLDQPKQLLNGCLTASINATDHEWKKLLFTERMIQVQPGSILNRRSHIKHIRQNFHIPTPSKKWVNSLIQVHIHVSTKA